MRCDEFENRLQRLLDARQNPRRSAELIQHAHICSACARQLDAWQRLEGRMAVITRPEQQHSTGPGRHARSGPLVGFALAAVWLAAGFLRSEAPPTPDRTGAQGVFQTGAAEGLAGGGAPELNLNSLERRVHEPAWWGSMMVAAWKPVDPLTESIQPLADSFQTAFELLNPHRRSSNPPAQADSSPEGATPPIEGASARSLPHLANVA